MPDEEKKINLNFLNLMFLLSQIYLRKIVDTVNALDADPRYSTLYLTKRD